MRDHATGYRQKPICTHSERLPWPFDPKRTAVVLIEYQNDFTSRAALSTERSRG